MGVIYITIQNLPQTVRFREEDVTCGVLLGPSEPKITMNSYLTPLVEELKQGWYSGFNDKTLNTNCMYIVAIN